jgi:hypothetical protein
MQQRTDSLEILGADERIEQAEAESPLHSADLAASAAYVRVQIEGLCQLGQHVLGEGRPGVLQRWYKLFGPGLVPTSRRMTIFGSSIDANAFCARRSAKNDTSSDVTHEEPPVAVWTVLGQGPLFRTIALTELFRILLLLGRQHEATNMPLRMAP